MTKKSRAFKIGKAFGKSGVLGRATLDTPQQVGVTEVVDSSGDLTTGDTGTSKFSAEEKKLFV
mgnify:FL=1